MPPKASSNTLSDREMQLLHNYHRCMKTKPEIDMDKFAAMSGFGGVPSARANIGRLLRKIAGEEETSGTVTPTRDGGDEIATPATPTSKKKSGGRKHAAAVDGTEAGSPTKKKASPTKHKKKVASDAGSQEDETVVKDEAEDATDQVA